MPRRKLAELIREGRVVMMGPIRQELLSAIKVKSQLDQVLSRKDQSNTTLINRPLR